MNRSSFVIASTSLFVVGAACDKPSPPPARAAAAPTAVATAARAVAATGTATAAPTANAARPAAPPVTPACPEPHALRKLAADDAAAKQALAELVATRTAADENKAAPRADGLTWKVENDGANFIVTDKAGKRVANVAVTVPAGGSMESRLSRTGKFVITEYGRRGPTLVPLNGGKGLTFDYGAIFSPDDTYALEPATAHPFSMLLEHGRDVRKIDLPSGKKHVVAKVPESAHPTKTDEQVMSMNAETGASICATGAVYVVNTQAELIVFRAKDDAKLVTVKGAGAGNPFYAPSGHWVVVGDTAYAID